ncbi:MAG: L-serine ammonia-lyase, iron-sulfur-dependent subunit beta [bacterium]|nr:L-serine ammonia-lyase, iron-sulfur-dependent subunit beta [bacterium]
MDIFDIIGPVMTGPSSSHTAGAVRIGRMAHALCGGTPGQVQIELHGSFAGTGLGHGTDCALLAGLLGLDIDSSDLHRARELADRAGLVYTFKTACIPEAHPNTARITTQAVDGSRHVITGASIGGGNILIVELDGYEVELSGSLPTLVAIYRDQPGMIALMAGAFGNHGINIATMRVSRKMRGEQAVGVIETDQALPPEITAELLSIDGLNEIRLLPALGGVHEV